MWCMASSRTCSCSARRNRWSLKSRSAWSDLLNAACQSGGRGTLEQPAQREVHVQGVTQPGHHLSGQERVATDLKEVIVDADALPSQHSGKDSNHFLFNLVS